MDCFPAHIILAATAINRVGYFFCDCAGYLPTRVAALDLRKRASKFRLKVGPTFLQQNLSD